MVFSKGRRRARCCDLIQKLCPCADGVKGYVRDPGALRTGKSLQCPFCPDGHRLRRHGHYWRTAIEPDPQGVERIAIQRLLCPATGRTVSLLPAFCIPRRQHGAAVLAGFVDGLVRGGLGLHAALRAVRAGALEHSTAQALLRGFRRRLHPLRAYLASVHARAQLPAADVPAAVRDLAPVVLDLLYGHPDLATALLVHATSFHESFHLGLA